jgi:hypothetical protein
MMENNLIFDLRGFTMEMLEAVVRIGLSAATTTLFVIVLLAWLRVRSRKMLFITIGFGIFFVHGLIAVTEIFSFDWHRILLGGEVFHLLIELIGLIFILLGTLKE